MSQLTEKINKVSTISNILLTKCNYEKICNFVNDFKMMTHTKIYS